MKITIENSDSHLMIEDKNDIPFETGLTLDVERALTEFCKRQYGITVGFQRYRYVVAIIKQ